MRVKLGNKIYTSDIEALMFILSREELDDLIEFSSEGTSEIRYLKYPEEKYNAIQIEQFRILPEEVFNKTKKVISEVESIEEEEEITLEVEVDDDIYQEVSDIVKEEAEIKAFEDDSENEQSSEEDRDIE